jgi:hypothetical protein
MKDVRMIFLLKIGGRKPHGKGAISSPGNMQARIWLVKAQAQWKRDDIEVLC